MADLDIDRARFVWASTVALQPIVLALIKTHPDPVALREAYRECLDRFAAQFLNSTLAERDVEAFQEMTAVLQAAIDALSQQQRS